MECMANGSMLGPFPLGIPKVNQNPFPQRSFSRASCKIVFLTTISAGSVSLDYFLLIILFQVWELGTFRCFSVQATQSCGTPLDGWGKHN